MHAVLVFAIPLLIIYKGSDAVSIIMNAVAVLFSLEVDNIIYAQGLTQQLRKEFEGNYRIHISSEDQARLERAKMAWLLAVPWIIFSIIVLARAGVSELTSGQGWASDSFLWLLGIAILPTIGVLAIAHANTAGPLTLWDLLRRTFMIFGRLLLALGVTFALLLLMLESHWRDR